MFAHSMYDPQGFPQYHHHHGGMAGTMERPTQINLLLGVGPAFWTLYSRVRVGSHLILPCTEGNTYNIARSGLRALGQGAVSDARKDVWMCSNHKAMVHPADGG